MAGSSVSVVCVDGWGMADPSVSVVLCGGLGNWTMGALLGGMF